MEILGIHGKREQIFEAKLEKLKAIVEMTLPTFNNELQNLNGRLARLICFDLKSIDRSLSFFQLFRAKQKFDWTT